MNDPFKTYGAFSWCELMTPDPEAAKRFYGTLFGWTLEDMDMGRGTYTVVKAGGAAIGGIMKRSPECAPDAPAHWGSRTSMPRPARPKRSAPRPWSRRRTSRRSDAFACSKTPKAP